MNNGLQNHLLLRAIREPRDMLRFTGEDWSRFLLAGRLSTLLPRIAVLARKAGITAQLPAKVQAHFAASEVGAEHSRTRLMWEINRIRRAFFGKSERIILLKGGAYAFAELPCAAGRVSSDIDILVPHERIARVETVLKANGWAAMKQDPYDEQYYRQWMHELPPLRHEQRGTVIDVHHTIIPPTSRLKPDAARLIADAQNIDDRFAVLAPTDMLLHSAVHLFHDGDLAGGLRDLYDIHQMLAQFGQDPNFWNKLMIRAAEQGLTRPLFYCCRYGKALLGTKIPHSNKKALNLMAPGRLTLALMDWLAVEALVPDNIFYPRRGRSLACFIMYLRSHWLRMPPLMLARHLATKAFKRWRYPVTSAPVPEANLQIDQ